MFTIWKREIRCFIIWESLFSCYGQLWCILALRMLERIWSEKRECTVFELLPIQMKRKASLSNVGEIIYSSIFARLRWILKVQMQGFTQNQEQMKGFRDVRKTGDNMISQLRMWDSQYVRPRLLYCRWRKLTVICKPAMHLRGQRRTVLAQTINS
jgi:hypothetical protein